MCQPAWKRCLRLFASLVALLIFLVVGAFSLYAQDVVPTGVTDQNRTGDLPFSSTVGTSLEHVVIGSGDLVVNIPIVHVQGRAGRDFDFGLRYDGRIFLITQRGANNQNDCVIQAHNYVPTGGIWQTNQPTLSYISATRTACFGGVNASGTATDTSNFILQDEQGAQHNLNVNYEQADCPTGQWAFSNS